MKQILLTDMSKCSPQSALSDKMERDHWRVVPYETEFGFDGKMVFTDPNWDSPELSLPLGVKGIYKIYVGINYPKSYLAQADGMPRPVSGSLELKLSSDKGFERAAIEETPGFTPAKVGVGKLVARSIQETYWRTAELDGDSLIFRSPGEPYKHDTKKEMANLSYVRLVEVTGEELEIYNKLKSTDETKNGIYIYCTGHLSGSIDGGKDYHPTDRQWFYDEIAPAVDGDFKIFNMEAIRGNYCVFKTKIGDVGGEDNVWKDEWLDPLQTFCEVGHEYGMKVFAGMRQIGGQYPTSYHPISWSRFFWENTHLCKVTKDGLPTTSLSLAFPEVCDYWLSLLEEACERDIDGIVIYLHRFNPFVMYEKPVVDSFIEKYGIDPRELDDRDERWVKHTASYLTEFLRMVRKLCDKKRLQLATTFFGVPTKLDKDPKNWKPIYYTYDVDAWIEEKIVDILMPMQAPKVELVRHWAELSKGEVEICPDIHPRLMPGEQFVELIQKYYDAGATGYCLNDAERRAPHLTEWAIEKKLGHRDMLDYLHEEAPKMYSRVPLKTILGYSCRYSFNNFGDEDTIFTQKGMTKEEIAEMESKFKHWGN